MDSLQEFPQRIQKCSFQHAKGVYVNYEAAHETEFHVIKYTTILLVSPHVICTRVYTDRHLISDDSRSHEMCRTIN